MLITLPISLELLTALNNTTTHTYFQYISWRNTIDDVIYHLSSSNQSITLVPGKDLTDAAKIASQYNIDKRSAAKLVAPPFFYPTPVTITDITQGITQLPLELFDEFTCNYLPLKPKMNSASKNTLLRVWLYMVWRINWAGGEKFSMPILNMASELNMNKNTFSAALLTLIKDGWIVRRGNYEFGGEKSHSYSYELPQDIHDTVKKISFAAINL